MSSTYFRIDALDSSNLINTIKDISGIDNSQIQTTLNKIQSTLEEISSKIGSSNNNTTPEIVNINIEDYAHANCVGYINDETELKGFSMSTSLHNDVTHYQTTSIVPGEVKVETVTVRLVFIEANTQVELGNKTYRLIQHSTSGSTTYFNIDIMSDIYINQWFTTDRQVKIKIISYDQ